MVLSKKVEQLSYKMLMDKLTNFDIYRYYVGPDIQVGRSMSNPMRKDKNPSFSIYTGKDGQLHHTDFADDGYHGTGIDLVMQMYGLSFPEAVKKIGKDFGITDGIDTHKRITSLYVQPEITQRPRALIQVTTRKFRKADVEWWGDYLISPEMLIGDDVYAVKELYLNRKKVALGKDEKVYAYYLPQGFKIYFVERPKGERWLSSIPLDTPGHLENLQKDKNGLITKSLKDYLVVKQVHPNTCYVQNESIGSVTEETARKITENSKEVYYAGDWDEPGVRAAKKITTKYEWNNLEPEGLLPIKDYADWVKAKKEKGLKEIEEFLIKNRAL